MAETLSTMIPLGTKAPEFHLLDTRSGKYLSLSETKSDIATVIMFICNHCPYVKYILPKLLEIVNIYQAKGICFIAISSNNAETYPEDGPNKMKEATEQHQFPFPYLYDQTQTTAKAYHAACTPDFYIFDRHLHCVYRGRFDDATPGNRHPVTGQDLSQALDNILSNHSISTHQKPSLGCNIKWKTTESAL
ncbi:MAG TPA: thioredoxin family protein [Gammaproteobacteria bacterium]|nr:thioredoxin family protein [Gammaproteobacteria bacterium]